MVGELIATDFAMIILIVLTALAIAALAVFLFAFWILMIIDCATRKFKNNMDKVVWMIVIVFLHILGAIIYYFIIKKTMCHPHLKVGVCDEQ